MFLRSKAVRTLHEAIRYTRHAGLAAPYTQAAAERLVRHVTPYLPMLHSRPPGFPKNGHTPATRRKIQRSTARISHTVCAHFALTPGSFILLARKRTTLGIQRLPRSLLMISLVCQHRRFLGTQTTFDMVAVLRTTVQRTILAFRPQWPPRYVRSSVVGQPRFSARRIAIRLV